MRLGEDQNNDVYNILNFCAHKSDAQPDSPQNLKVGYLWFDSTNKVYKYSDGTNWVTLTASTVTLSGDVTGTLSNTTVSSVGGYTASNIAAQILLVSNATNLATGNALVRRDSNGDFSARNITATSFIGNLAGNAATASKVNNALTNGNGIASFNYDGSVGSVTVAIVAGGVTNVMLAGGIDLTTKVTGVLPTTNGGTGNTTGTANLLANTNAAGQSAITAINSSTGSVIGQTHVDFSGIATTAYVDAATLGYIIKTAVRFASTTNGVLATAFAAGQTMDGGTLVLGDRILLKDQINAADNGIRVVTNGTPTRDAEMDTWAEVPRSYIFVSEGATNANSSWVCTNAVGGTLDTTPIIWKLFAKAGSITASNVGTLGSGVFDTKNGSNLQFKNIAAGSNKISISEDGSKNIQVDIAEANLNMNNTGTTLSATKGGTGVAVLSSVTAGSNKVTIGGTPTNSVIQPFSVDINESNLTISNIGGTLPVSKGGTGATSVGNSGDVIVSNGTGFVPRLTKKVQAISQTIGGSSNTVSVSFAGWIKPTITVSEINRQFIYQLFDSNGVQVLVTMLLHASSANGNPVFYFPNMTTSVVSNWTLQLQLLSY